MREKILVIEDDEVMRELMRMTLEQNGYEVATAEDGVRGYDSALFLKPDLIVTDIKMPGADGIHVVRRVRDTRRLKPHPFWSPPLSVTAPPHSHCKLALMPLSPNQSTHRAFFRQLSDYWLTATR